MTMMPEADIVEREKRITVQSHKQKTGSQNPPVQIELQYGYDYPQPIFVWKH